MLVKIEADLIILDLNPAWDKQYITAAACEQQPAVRDPFGQEQWLPFGLVHNK